MSTMLPVKIDASGELTVARCQCSSTALPRACSDASPFPQAIPAQVRREKGSYGQILKSSALVGGSSVLNVGIGIVRTKAMAMLLGPSGFGLFGLYGSIVDLTQAVAGMGVNSSGVRQIAEAAGSGDHWRIAQSSAVLRRVSMFLGLLGAALLIVFCKPISKLTFGNSQHAGAVALLSVAVFFRLISAGQGALIQGLRRIADLAKMGVWGALLGAVLGISLVFFFGEQGVVPSLIGVAAMTIFTSWWYSRKIRVAVPVIAVSQLSHEAADLLKLGFAFMASGLMTMGVAYAVRIAVFRTAGFEATGLYQSAWTLGGLYVGFILQAMGADFYPRLTANSDNNAECNRLVNEQTLVGILLAGPGIIATLTFAPLIVALFYTAKFSTAVPLLRWICLGATLQVVTWPMGFIIVAKGKQGIFFFAELAWAIFALALAWACIRRFGLNGAGMAFFGSYVFHAVLIYPIVHRLSSFRWTRMSQQAGVLLLCLIAIVFGGFYVLKLWQAVCVGLLGFVVSSAYSIHIFSRLFSLQQLPRLVQRVVVWIRLALFSRS